jgi:Outer membrane protein beta-barrel domain
MKKLILISTIIILLCANIINASAQKAFNKGEMNASIGIGFPNLNLVAVKVFQIYPDFASHGTGPFHAKFEYAISDYLGIGLTANYVNVTSKFTNAPYNYKGSWSSIKFNARTNVHVINTKNFDGYLGLGIGYGSGTSKMTTNDPSQAGIPTVTLVPFGFETTIGARYFVSNKWAIYSELGIAKSIIQTGVCYKF